jgi:hypothetical protein
MFRVSLTSGDKEHDSTGKGRWALGKESAWQDCSEGHFMYLSYTGNQSSIPRPETKNEAAL